MPLTLPQLELSLITDIERQLLCVAMVFKALKLEGSGGSCH